MENYLWEIEEHSIVKEATEDGFSAGDRRILQLPENSR